MHMESSQCGHHTASSSSTSWDRDISNLVADETSKVAKEISKLTAHTSLQCAVQHFQCIETLRSTCTKVRGSKTKQKKH